MNDDMKRRRLFVRLIYVFIAAALLSAAMIVFLPSFGGAMLTASAVFCAAAAFAAGKAFSGFERLYDSIGSIAEEVKGYAAIRYDKKTETAYISGRLSEITGIETAGQVLDETDYKKLITDMISYPSGMGSDIYMAACPECWIKIYTYENEFYEFTVISDVSELVSCRNIIKSLKYYDSTTGLLCRDAFIAKVRSVSGSRAGKVGLVTLLISGVDRLTSFKGTSAADKVVSSAAAFVKKFENPHNVFAGRTATNELCVLVTDTYDEGCRKYAEKLYSGLAEAFSGSEGGEYINVYCGYALFDGEENDVGSMMSSVEYAAFEAKSSAAAAPVEFDMANYVLRAYDFKKIQVFNKVVGENMVSYHFQPVVDSRTGSIFGYEALMRPREIDGIKLSPLEVVEIAEKQGMSIAVENMTLFNTIGFLSENREMFSDKKLFVNAIPNCYLADEQYESLYSSYNDVFDKLIVEITENVQITQQSMDVLRERYSSRGALIAMDDYGTGYSNESTLLTIKPNFIKIDHSLIAGINSDVQKQHLVSNIVDFARNHGIKTLSEGVETREELETVITFGIDLIQGYYTSRPSPALIPEIPADIREEILGINLKNIGYSKKTYVVDTDEPRDLAELAVQGYTEISVVSENVTLKSGTSHAASLCISCADGYKGTININGVNIFGLDAPVLTLGKGCEVVLNAEGINQFSYEGIRVPAESSLIIRGSGQICLDINNNVGVIIGGSYLQDFGSIKIDMDGSLKINSQSDNMVAIGGGFGGEGSSIELAGGNICAELKGLSIIGVGSVSGNADIKLGRCSLNITGAGQNVIAVGSKSGNISIESNSKVEASCSGDNCCIFGTLENGSGKMKFNGGSYDMTIHAKNGVAMGAMGGNVNVDVTEGVYSIFCEGNSAAGVGDCFGSGNVTVSGGIFKMHIASSMEVSIGSAKGKTVISGGNIFTDSREKITALSPFGEPLEEVRTECSGKFSRKISSGEKEYVYTAYPVGGESFVSVYLPQGYDLTSSS